MDDTYETRDQYVAAWLMLYNPGTIPEIRVETDLSGSKPRDIFYYSFPGRERQEQLVHEYAFSQMKEYVNMLFVQKTIRKDFKTNNNPS